VVFGDRKFFRQVQENTNYEVKDALEKKYKRIVVKVGSNVLTRADGTLDTTRMSALVDQIAELMAGGMEVILVSSGAVAAGRSEVVPKPHHLDAVGSRQLFSAVGQGKLIGKYYELFREHGIVCGQVLTTKESFGTREHYLNQRNCMAVMLESGVVPVVNENDTISVTELMFTDNDELSGLVAAMMDAEALVILSNIDGIYDGDPADPASRVIERILPGESDLSRYVQSSRSSFGRGGMLTKSRIAAKVASEGTEVIIANGKRENILCRLMGGKQDEGTLCTRFVPASTPKSAIKKWIAHSESFAKGEIHISPLACQALTGEKATSLLPIGVSEIRGDFEKDDIVRIIAPDGRQIGVGRVSTGSQQARRQMGRKGGKALVHYDYLCLD